jgi:hypothetical protein
MTASTICAEGGASATHGDVAVTSKKTEPVNRTADKTSDSTSAVMSRNLEMLAKARIGGWQTSAHQAGMPRDHNNFGRVSKNSGSAIIRSIAAWQ